MAGATLKKHTDHRGVTTLTLDRPEKANAIDRALLTQLFEALQDAAASDWVRVVVLRGAGKHFCSGADFSDLREADAESAMTVPGLCEFLDELPKPTICVVHGACMGAGLALAACADMVIATRDAYFSIPEVRLGLPPAPLMPALIRGCGARFLRRYLLSGGRFDVAAAYRAGLVQEVCDLSDLEGRIGFSIDEYLWAAPNAVAIAKSLLRQLSYSGHLPSRNELETTFNSLSTSSEAKEGVASFKEGRPPQWYRV